VHHACCINVAIGFDGGVMGVVYDDTHQWLLGSCVKFGQTGFWWGKVQFEAKKQSL